MKESGETSATIKPTSAPRRGSTPEDASRREAALDEALRQTFPASDPIAPSLAPRPRG